MAFNYSKLRGRIREVFGTESAFAEACGVTKSTMSKRLNNGSELDQETIIEMSKLLKIENDDIGSYFFTV